MGRIIPYIMENIKCLKPPTRYVMYVYPLVLSHGYGSHGPFRYKIYKLE